MVFTVVRSSAEATVEKFASLKYYIEAQEPKLWIIGKSSNSQSIYYKDRWFK